MDGNYSSKIYRGYIVKGDLIGAINYVKQFPEQSERYEQFMARFEKEQYLTYEIDTALNEILTVYQKYYQDVFYLRIDREEAADRLRTGLSGLVGIDDADTGLDSIEENQVAEAFRRGGFSFLGGRTSGYYGPYIWRTTEARTYEVELPDGMQTYTVNLLDGFLSRSWMDYLSFGEVGTGGWTGGDGTINCVKSCYDLDSERFQVSLLKHEAQHVRDLANDRNMSSEDLEYRAKLVELIYSSERNMLDQFAQEAASSDKSNGHASAANRILEGFARKLDRDQAEIGPLPNDEVQAVARELFQESSR